MPVPPEKILSFTEFFGNRQDACSTRKNSEFYRFFGQQARCLFHQKKCLVENKKCLFLKAKCIFVEQASCLFRIFG